MQRIFDWQSQVATTDSDFTVIGAGNNQVGCLRAIAQKSALTPNYRQKVL
jgi:hypothetical protein